MSKMNFVYSSLPSSTTVPFLHVSISHIFYSALTFNTVVLSVLCNSSFLSISRKNKFIVAHSECEQVAPFPLLLLPLSVEYISYDIFYVSTCSWLQ